jgi:hypothetical protein
MFGRLKRIFSVNPTWSDSMPPKDYRTPAPSEQPTYTAPTTDASNLSKNYYFQRDVRRQYPALIVVDQADLARRLTRPSESTDMVTEHVSLSKTLQELDKPLFDLPPIPNKPFVWKMSTEFDYPDASVYWPQRMFK